MPKILVKVYGKHDVVFAAKKRLVTLYKNNSYIYVSFSGGKDSLAIIHLILELHESGKIDITKTRVIFVDEEAIYPDVEEVVKRYRKMFLKLGAKFYWLCLPIKHYNCFNMLYNDETFICWDPEKKDVWIRDMPKFAIKNHTKLIPGDNYQAFMMRIKDGPQVIGLRARESYQRLLAMSQIKANKINGGKNAYYPIYDWTLDDVWWFMQDRQIQFPIVYVYMWKIRTPKQNLRISQFFSIDTAKSLVQMMEFYPELYEKILAREPNAYLAMMYWDSDMFRRSSSKSNELNESTKKTLPEMKEEISKMLPEFKKSNTPKIYKQLMGFMTKYSDDLTDKGWEALHGLLKAGDPKGRTYRSLYTYLSKGYKTKSGTLKLEGYRNE